MNPKFRSSIWNARELLFILLLSIVIERISTAHPQSHPSTKTQTQALASYVPETLLSSCTETGGSGQNNKYGFLSNRPSTAK